MARCRLRTEIRVAADRGAAAGPAMLDPLHGSTPTAAMTPDSTRWGTVGTCPRARVWFNHSTFLGTKSLVGQVSRRRSASTALHQRHQPGQSAQRHDHHAADPRAERGNAAAELTKASPRNIAEACPRRPIAQRAPRRRWTRSRRARWPAWHVRRRRRNCGRGRGGRISADRTISPGSTATPSNQAGRDLLGLDRLETARLIGPIGTTSAASPGPGRRSPNCGRSALRTPNGGYSSSGSQTEDEASDDNTPTGSAAMWAYHHGKTQRARWAQTAASPAPGGAPCRCRGADHREIGAQPARRISGRSRLPDDFRLLDRKLKRDPGRKSRG